MANIFEDEFGPETPQLVLNTKDSNIEWRNNSRPTSDNKSRQVTRDFGRNIHALPKGKGQLGLMTVFIFLLLFVSTWMISPIHWVNSLSVSGNTFVSSQEIISVSGVRSIDNFREVVRNRQQITKIIKEAYPVISDITFIRNGWAGATIQVNEHQIVGWVENGDKIAPLLENGQILLLDKDSINNDLLQAQYPKIVSNGQQGKLVDVANALRQLTPEVLSKIGEVEVLTELAKPKAVILTMRDGMFVKAQTPTLAEKLNRYDEMMAVVGQQRGTLNLEVGAYFTPDIEDANSVKLDSNIDN